MARVYRVATAVLCRHASFDSCLLFFYFSFGSAADFFFFSLFLLFPRFRLCFFPHWRLALALRESSMLFVGLILGTEMHTARSA